MIREKSFIAEANRFAQSAKHEAERRERAAAARALQSAGLRPGQIAVKLGELFPGERFNPGVVKAQLSRARRSAG